MVVDYGSNILAGYMRGCYHSPTGWDPPQVKEVSGATRFY